MYERCFVENWNGMELELELELDLDLDSLCPLLSLTMCRHVHNNKQCSFLGIPCILY